MKNQISPVKKVRVKSAALRREELKTRTAALHMQSASLKRKFTSVEEKIKAVPYPELLGFAVTHKQFGAGKVEEQKENYISVAFSAGRKDFQLPDAIALQYLKIDNAEVSAVYGELSKLLKKRNDTTKQLGMTARMLQQLEVV